MWRVLKLCRLLTGIAFAASLVVLGAARLTYRDPFAPYRAIMPGQSIDALKDYPCRFRSASESDTALGECQFSPAFGVFQNVTLSAVHRIITRVTIYDVQPDALYLGDLIACWGRPFTIVDNYPDGTLTLDAYWDSQMDVQLSPPPYGTSPDEFLAVRYLAFNQPWKPCRS